MDSQQFTAQRVSKLIQGRRFRAFGIACLILSALVVLQVGNLNRNTPMCELLTNCNLANGDLQRMQIALSQSGLSEFKIADNRILVPTAQHASYLQAIADKNAIPQDLRESEESSPSINPFLSRSQQLSIERAAKKRQIREMVVRLPFVEQAWFEMDQSDSHSAFASTQQSAVISIQTRPQTPLNSQQVDTVKRMIGGAVAGLDPKAIVVIDLSAGAAHLEASDPQTTKQVHYQRIASEQQRFYETRIRESLQDYPGIEVSVHIEVKPGVSDKLTHAPIPTRTIPAVHLQTPSQPLTAGANAAASLQDFELPNQPGTSPPRAQPEFQVELISYDENPNSERLEKTISVSIDVPQQLVHDLFGAPTIDRSSARNHSDYQSALAKDTQAKFAQLQSEIIQKIRPLLPASSFRNRATFPIAVNLIREPLPAASPWFAQAQQFAAQHWPSAAVLIIGLMLLTIVTRNPDSIAEQRSVAEPYEDQDVLSIDMEQAEDKRLDQDTEVRLSNLIEKDPDAAAKVIEAWIRDAA